MSNIYQTKNERCLRRAQCLYCGGSDGNNVCIIQCISFYIISRNALMVAWMNVSARDRRKETVH